MDDQVSQYLDRRKSLDLTEKERLERACFVALSHDTKPNKSGSVPVKSIVHDTDAVDESIRGYYGLREPPFRS